MVASLLCKSFASLQATNMLAVTASLLALAVGNHSFRHSKFRFADIMENRKNDLCLDGHSLPTVTESWCRGQVGDDESSLCLGVASTTVDPNFHESEVFLKAEPAKVALIDVKVVATLPDARAIDHAVKVGKEPTAAVVRRRCLCAMLREHKKEHKQLTSMLP